MPMHRKKPVVVVVEVFQMTRARQSSRVEWPEWLLAAWDCGHLSREDGVYAIETLENTWDLTTDDYIIRDADGDLTSCNPVIFAATYDAVEQETD